MQVGVAFGIGVALVAACAGCASAEDASDSSVVSLASGPNFASSIPSSTTGSDGEASRISSGTTSTIDVSPLPADKLFLVALLGPTVSETQAFDSAINSYRSSCMAAAGFGGPIPPFSSLYASPEQLAEEVRFLYFDDRAEVEQFGYFWPERGAPAPTPTPETTIPEAMAEALVECNRPFQEALLEAYESNGLTADSPDVLDTQIYDAVTVRSDVQRAYKQWRECMSTAGFPGATLRQRSRETETVELALADFDCRVSTGYTAVVINAQAAEVAAWSEANLGTIEAYRHVWAGLADAVIDISAH